MGLKACSKVTGNLAGMSSCNAAIANFSIYKQESNN